MSEELEQQPLDQHLDRPLSAEEKALQAVEKTIPAILAPETAMPAIRFALFNFFMAYPNEQAEGYKELLDREIAKLSALGEKEEKYKNSKRIPTIGVELEFPNEGLDDSNIDIDNLEKIGIRSGPEINHDELWELRSSPSFSATTQSRIIEETRKSNIIGSEENLSMHVNIGIPGDIDERNQDTIYSTSSTSVFISSGTLAFTSVERLKTRKTQSVYTVKNTSIEDIGKNNSFRLELRTHEFKDYTAYRALNEIQLVAVAYFEYIRSFNQKDTEEKLIEVWHNFSKEYKDVCEKHKLPTEELTAFDTDYKDTIDVLIKHPEIQTEIRLMYSKYAHKIKEILFPEQDSKSEE